FPTPLSTLDSALTLFADPFYQDGPNDMGIGWNVLASLQRVAVGVVRRTCTGGRIITSPGALSTLTTGCLRCACFISCPLTLN
ncbi:hypothetical protein QUH19_27865, partial [Klebsiella pneumoniae]|nr:hypothetical protein [Klebsiella pneumoniae]